MWTVDGSESGLRAWLNGRIFDFRVHGPSSRPVLTFFILVLFFSILFFLNLKLLIKPFSYFITQYNIKTFLEKNYDSIIRLFNVIVHHMNKVALRLSFVVKKEAFVLFLVINSQRTKLLIVTN